MQFIVLSSSKGTTFQAILDQIADGSLTAECLGLVSDREDRGCVAKARTANLPVKIVTKKSGESREAYDERLDAAIRELGNPDAVAAIGWLYLFTAPFVTKWKNKILNVHPSLLPKHPGLHAHDEVLAAKETESGMTIHIIDEGLDTGKILVQKKCSVESNDTIETLKIRVQELEKEWYPKVLQMIETKEITLPS
ncbi:phosphoribosylglycinamide formyltransferase [Candidatus Peribacteria bacterium RIFCSPHIGHO2_02_FULL_52_16]|nr:MAG: phosphoribosylglycinamide formyltransferase [Candidatus Peribacteria bacterium RIFCSPHIGHO2_01_FULL_51_35]OGJ60648.1 MAG: phosphoribosylglycinamide formyltransferase [Candidatus Peribacteria bacterium RIFCSPHIGHO2_02_FULL_52_16]